MAWQAKNEKLNHRYKSLQYMVKKGSMRLLEISTNVSATTVTRLVFMALPQLACPLHGVLGQQILCNKSFD